LKVGETQPAPAIRRVGEEALRRWMRQCDKRHAKRLRDGRDSVTGAAAQRDDLL
jgi:hypothetical protein